MSRIAWLLTLLLPLAAAAAPAPGGDEVRALLAADAARLQAMVALDEQALAGALADDLSYGHAGGQVDSKAALLESMRNGSLRYRRLDTRTASARSYGCLGVVLATVDVEVEVHGRRQSLLLGYTASYARRQDRWVLVAYQSVQVPPPVAANAAPVAGPIAH
ncbi:MAG: nuclear transport factor 2 family protein [Proteobacteria bacterium]|nr:nuclear transport factor 2 family protein [Pseudomonadota bacterium]